MTADDNGGKKIASIINPEAVLDELAQQRAYDYIGKKLDELKEVVSALEEVVSVLKLMKAKANRKQLTAGDLMQFTKMTKETIC